MKDKQPAKTLKRYVDFVISTENTPPAAGVLPASTLVDRLFSGLRDDPTTRAGAIRLLAQMEAEENAAAAAANPNNHKVFCPECGHEFHTVITNQKKKG